MFFRWLYRARVVCGWARVLTARAAALVWRAPHILYLPVAPSLQTSYLNQLEAMATDEVKIPDSTTPM